MDCQRAAKATNKISSSGTTIGGTNHSRSFTISISRKQKSPAFAGLSSLARSGKLLLFSRFLSRLVATIILLLTWLILTLREGLGRLGRILIAVNHRISFPEIPKNISRYLT